MAAKEQKLIVEPKKDEFKQYLESTSIADSLTKILISLYEEPNRPENSNADEFIARNFQKKEDIDVVFLQNEIRRLKDIIEKQNSEIAKLNSQVERAVKEIGSREFLEEN